MASLDHYCERTDPRFWAEPLNALSNLGFIVVAWLLWRDARNLDRLDSGVRLLLAIVFFVGIGSFLFHTFANTATLWLDILPILFFLLTYLWLSVRRILNWNIAAAAASVAVFLLAIFGAGRFGYLLNGAPFYLPALLMLIGLSIAHAERRGEYVTMLGATIVFVFALTFRTLDNTICHLFPTGTHFLWHLLNAVAMYYATRALLLHRAPPSEKSEGPHL
jgi:hypothetical protein